MKKYLLLFLLLGFGNSAFAARPTWVADLANNGSNSISTTMTIVSQLDMMGTPSSDSQDLVAVFINGQVRGVQSPNTSNGNGGFVAIIQVRGNTGETMTFKYYDDSEDVEYIAVNPPITFAVNDTRGSLSNPILITANNFPTDISLSNSQIAENQPANTLVGVFNTADLDGGDTFTYSFASGTGSANNASFSIDGNQLRTAEMFNFETKNFYNVRVKVTDSQGGTFEKAFTISISNANDPITNITISDTVIQENKPTGTIIGTFASTDEDSGNPQSYTLNNTGGLGINNSSFIIEGTALKSNEVFNYELKKNYQIQVRGSDGAGSTFFKQFEIAITDANDQPDSIQISSNTISENLALNNLVGNLITFDQDTFDTHTYTFYESGNTNDNASFIIQNGNQVFSNATFDYETDSVKELDIRSTDNRGLSVERRISIKILNQNDAPSNLELSSNSVDENLEIGAFVGEFTAIDEDAFGNFTYSLIAGTGSTNNASFQIVDDSLRTNQKFDFEVKSNYTIRVQVQDLDGGTAERIFAISINNANDTTTNIQLSSLIVEENKLVGTTVGTFTSTDQDVSDNFTYSLVAGMGDANNLSFRTVGSQLLTDSTFDFETKFTYQIRVRSTDAGGLFFEKAFTISIQNANDAPTKINYTSKNVNENQAIGVAVGTLSTVDQDAGDSHIYSIVGGTGQAFFLIENTLVKTNQMLDFETDSLYTLAIQTRDANGLTYTQTDTIKVVDTNDSPTDIQLSENRVFENMPIGTGFGKFSATDADAKMQNFSYSLVAGTGSDDNGSFLIMGDSLKTDATFDFEIRPTYSVRIRVQDGFGGGFEKAFAITIRDANDAPTNISMSSVNVLENRPIATVVGNLSTTDQDASDTFTYQLVTGSGSFGNSAFGIVGNQLLTDTIFNFENKKSYFVRIKTTDSKGLSFEKSFLITILDANDAPTKINFTSKTIQENRFATTTVGKLSSTDEDTSDSHIYTIVGGSGQSAFILENDLLKTNRMLDYESDSSYTLVIRTEDGSGATYTQTDTIKVIDVNDSPTNIDLSENTISENLPVKSMVGLLTSEDEDAKMQNFTYSLVAGSGAINNASFQITNDTLQTNVMFDFEAKSSYSVRIRVNDGFGGSFEKVFAITIIDANDAPTNLQVSTGIVAENQLVGTAVGDFTTVDQDVGDNFTYTFVTGMGDEGNDAFTIVGNKLVTGLMYNFEFQNSYSIRVRTTDAGGLFFEKNFTIQIQDVNDAPTAIVYSSKSVAENKPKGTTVGTLSSVDEDATDSHTYRIVGGTGQAIFVIENNQLKTDEVLDYEFDSLYTLVVETRDLAGASFTQTDTVKIIDVNDPPTDIVLVSQEVSENLPIGSAVGNLEIRDSDAPIQSFTFALASGLNDADNANFSIEDDTLRTAVVFNFEQKSVYRIRLRVTDDQGGVFEKPFNITILNGNDNPTDISLSNNSIQENEMANATVGLFSTTDEDVAEIFTYTLENGVGGEDNASFLFVGNQLQTVNSLNYESDSSLNILIKSTDSGGLSFTEAFTIKVIDKNEKPILEDATFEVQEFAENGTTIGQMTFSDVDFNQTFSFAGFGETNPFAINSSTGEITLSNKDEIDFEEETSYQFFVVVSDNGTPTLTDTATVIVNVADEIEAVLPVTNFVSPNNDGRNDFWAINTPDLYQGYELIIYDANGQDVYKSANYQNEWNGQDNSNGELPSGVYFYTFRKPGTQFSYKGSIHLVRN